MLGKVLRFDPDRRRRAADSQTGSFRQPDDARDNHEVAAPDDDENPRGLLSLVSVRILRDDDDTDF